MIKFITRLWPEEEGEDVVEYALLLMLLVTIATTAVKGIAQSVDSIYSHASTKVISAGSSAAFGSSGGGSSAYGLGSGRFEIDSSGPSHKLHKKKWYRQDQ